MLATVLLRGRIMNSLKPCPFCKSNAEVFTVPQPDWDEGPNTTAIRCHNHKCELHSFYGFDEKTWNSRPIEDELYKIILESTINNNYIDTILSNLQKSIKTSKVITLCGSSKFKDLFNLLNKNLSLMGYVVFSLGVYGHSGDKITEEQKIILDKVH